MKTPPFKRKIYDQMLRWKQEKQGTTALLLNGARRIGKTTVALLFAAQEYDSYLAIDFANASPSVVKLFDDLTNLDQFFASLQFFYHKRLVRRKSVIVLDEIQLCPRARQAIKYLVADGRFDYIETGSLLSIKKNTQGILIPSEETRLNMYPLDYEEFRWALSDEVTVPLLRQNLQTLRPLTEAVNRQLMRDFRLYLLVGGMPQAVAQYLETQNFQQVDDVKRSIIDLYDADFYKVDASGRTSILYHNIPAQLNSNAQRYRLGSVKGASAKALMESLAVLKDSMTVNLAYHSNDPNVGLMLHINTNLFKLFCADTGLFITLAFWDKSFTSNTIYGKLLSDKLSADLGYVYENVVAQMLTASGNQLFYHTFPTPSGKHNYEVDFLLARENKICPIEVKSSSSQQHASLDAFTHKYASRIGVRYLLSPKDIHKDQDLICLPLYMTPLL